ncbi:MAG: DPP IV N-terminal domain-containing protein [Bacteroidales bacterium]|nr:DPP IV N-terminal domain-containing protein [Bacteroidales bacterium]
MKHLILTVFALFVSMTGIAQTLKTPTLDDLMWGGTNYWNLQPKTPATAWWGDALVHTDVEACTIKFDARPTQPSRNRMATNCLFTLDDVNAVLPEGDKMRTLQNAVFPDGSQTIVRLTSDNSLFLYDWSARSIVWRVDRVRGAQAASFSQSAKATAYVKDDNLFVRNAEGRDAQLSTDGSRQIVYGQSVHRQEFGIEDGLFWSPKGSALAFYRMDQTMVTDFPLVELPLDPGADEPGKVATVAQLAPEAYPMAGMDIHKVTVGVYNMATGKTVYLRTPEVRTEFHEGGEAVYFSNICWSPDEKYIFIQELPRTQDRSDLVVYSAETGERLAVLNTETNARFVEPQHPLTFIPWDPSSFIFQSEKDGFNHYYVGQLAPDARSIKSWRQLTSGEYEDLELLGFNTQTKAIIASTNESGHIRENVYAIDYKTGRRTLLDNGVGVHRCMGLSENGLYYVDRWSKPDLYREVDVMPTSVGKKVQFPVGTAINTLQQNVESPWKDYTMPEVEGGRITAADGVTPLYYRMVLPVGFDPTKKYPTVVYVYGGPHATNVKESWCFQMRNWEAHMANRGYLLFILDNRGSGDRGFDFESCTHRHLGDIEMEDQIKGVEFLKTLPYVDADRMGVHGWSFGGFMTTNLMCSYPDVFKVGVAGGPVIDWRYYEAMYGERYMDAPQDNPEGYKSTSLVGKAKNLKGRLQIIVGYNDPTCVLQHNLAFLRAAEDAGTQPDYFVYPGQGHNMMGKDMVHLHERITRYFDDYLK